MSRGEREICYYLDIKKIKYETQKTFKGCRNKISLRFDFYLPMYNILIEYDGNAHFHEVKLFGGKKYFEEKRNNDIIKNMFCIENNKKLLRISYTDYKNIHDILENYLKTSNHNIIEFSDCMMYTEMVVQTYTNMLHKSSNNHINIPLILERKQ